MHFCEYIDTETGIQKSSLSRVYAPRFQPVGEWSSSIKFKLS